MPSMKLIDQLHHVLGSALPSTYPFTEPSPDKVAQMRMRLLDLISRAADIDNLSQAGAGLSLANLRLRVERDSLIVLVAGQFNAGKTTIVNTLIGQSILPVMEVPATAIPCFVQWGERPAARLFSRAAAASEVEQGHPENIRLDRLAQYATISAENQGAAFLELDWPFTLGRRGLVLIDTPGLNDDIERDSAAMELVGRPDVIVYIMRNP